MKVTLDGSCAGPLAENPKRVYRTCKVADCAKVTLNADRVCDFCKAKDDENIAVLKH